MSTEHTTPRYLNTKAAASYLGLSARYLEGLRLTGGGPLFVSFGKAVRYDPSDLNAWAERLKRKSTSDRQRAA